MKRLSLLLSIISLFIIFPASAQRFEFYGGYSYGSEIGTGHGYKLSNYDDVLSKFSQTDLNVDLQRSAMTLGFNIKLFRNFSAGLSWTGLSKCKRVISGSPEAISSYAHLVEMEYSSNTVLFNMKYEWFKFKKLHCYSTAGIGAIFYSTPERVSSTYQDKYTDLGDPNDGYKSANRMAWQVSFLGIEYRLMKILGVFIEGGLGHQGALMTGLKVNL